MNEHRGHFNGNGLHIAIVIGRFNQFINQSLLDGAMECLVQHGVNKNDIQTYWVPGGFEIPLAAQKAAQSGRFEAVICLGAVIRGATPHFDYVAGAAASGISRVMMETGIPVLFGVLTTDSIEQAIERAGTKSGNKGWDTALSAIEMVNLLGKM